MKGGRSDSVLVVHPTSLALRQLQRRTLKQTDFIDARGQLTFAGLLASCIEAARPAGLLGQRRSASDLDYEILLLGTARRFQQQSAAHQGPLAGLASQAVEDTLDQLNAFLAPLADRATDVVALLAQGNPKNQALATLYGEFQSVACLMGVNTEAEENAALLRLLRNTRAAWPAALRETANVRFVAVRSITPMLESVSRALAAQLGGEHVRIEHILEQHEQEWWGEKFLAESCRLLFGSDAAAEAEDTACHAEQTWQVIAGLREAYAMRDPGLATDARANVGFSRSAGLYGEVEDLARRICWELEQQQDDLRPEDIALVVPNVGRYSDAIADVFRRFRLPYYFRRGRAVLSAPVTQAMLRVLEVRATRSRDAFCALLESPWIDWGNMGMPKDGAQPSAVADLIRRAGIEPNLPDAKMLAARVRNYLRTKRVPESLAQTRGEFAAQALQFICEPATPGTLGVACQHILKELRGSLGTEEQVRQFLRASVEADGLTRQAALFNSRAFAAILDQLQALATRSTDTALTWGDLLTLLRRVLRNVTVADGTADESGVWVLNPHDAAGLRFRIVLVAGLNAGVFPALPAPSPVFSDAELTQLREQTGKQGPLPQTALALSGARRSQDNLLFLTTLATAAERLVFSYQSHDEEGEELAASICFTTAWRLAGWPSWKNLPKLPPDPYDRWRLEVAPQAFREFWNMSRTAKNMPVWQRQPFPGESFLTTRPLELCRAADEARQQAARALTQAGTSATAPAVRNTDSVNELVARSLMMEAERDRIFTARALQPNQPAEIAAPGTRYIGAIAPAIWQTVRRTPRTIPDLSATELETLATCPFKFYLQRVLHLETLQTNELEATPLALGTLVHRVMFHALALLRGDAAPPELATVCHAFAELCVPAYALPVTEGAWRIQAERTANARPVVQFLPHYAERYAEFITAVAEAELAAAETALADMLLGAVEQRGVVRTNLISGCRNLLRLSLQPAVFEGSALPELQHFPALLEFEFRSTGAGATSSVEFTHPDNATHRLRVHGKVDRVDLLADAAGNVRALTVVDYKGTTKSQLTAFDLAEAIIAGRNCQLPVYGLVAQAAFGHQLPLLLQYQPYRGDFSDIAKQTRKNWITLVGVPVATEELRELIGAPDVKLMTAFARRIFQCVEIIEHGQFLAQPQDCAHCEFRGCCRYTAPALEAEMEAENQPG